MPWIQAKIFISLAIVKKSPGQHYCHYHYRALESLLNANMSGNDIQAKPYRWPHNATFSRETTALIVIDMQVDFCAPGGYMDWQGVSIEPARAIIPQIQSLLAAFRNAGFQIYHTREGHRPDLSTLSSREQLRSRLNPSGKGIGDEGPLGRLLIRGEKGHEIVPELSPLPSEPVIDKPGRSAFQHTDLKLLLDNRGIKNIILCGVCTDVCVSSTMVDGSESRSALKISSCCFLI